jgi:hypothetical protein
MRPTAVVVLLVAVPIALWRAATSVPEKSDTAVAIYDANPSHIWNRLYAALLIREDRHGIAYGQDLLAPALWTDTKHLLEPKSHRQAMQVLDEFLQTHGENLIHDPIKRAMLQHDLWAVFDWSAAREPEWPGQPGYETEKRELQVRLAQVLKRLALTPKEIESLPDNYTQAVASGEFAKEYDPANRERPFLPPDLFEQHGPWVEMTAGGEPFGDYFLPAMAHVSSVSGRSRFLIFVRLPGGRKATFDYFRELWNFPEPWVVRQDAPNQTEVNPKLPSFPAGTEVVLVRQMTLFDNQGNLAPAPITESVQIRVYRSVTPNDMENSFTPQARVASSGQDSYEIRLSRPLLFAGKSGGLRTVGQDERELITLFSQGRDPLEEERGFSLDQLSKATPITQECVACHRGAGIASLNSRHNLLKPNFVQRDADYALPPRWWENDGTVYWKQQRYDWGLLSGYWKADGRTN